MKNYKAYRGEVMFMRAYAYYRLVQAFGPVTILRDNNQVDLSRSTANAVIKYALEDLQYGIDNMPRIRPNQSEHKGAVTAFSAAMLAAKFHLNQGNYAKVEELTDVYKEFNYGQEGLNMAYRMKVKEGGSLGDLYGKGFERDDAGKIIYDKDSGLPVLTANRDDVYLGNSNPDWTLGWSNTFSVYDFTLNFLIDASFGGKVLSFTQGSLDQSGVSKNVGEAMDRGYVELEGTQIKDVQGFYGKVGNIDGSSEYYIYKRTNVRLRELSVGYNLPAKWMEKSKVFKNINLALVARNLFFFYKDAPFDPDALL